jgi:LacI family transcriptional regulator
MLGDLVHDWYVAGLIAGIDEAAEETGVSLELLGHREGEAAAASRRLEQSKPDVLAFAAPAQRHALLFGEARRLGIPCIGTGTFMPTLGLPAVCEDGEAGSRQAVELFVKHGHRRIGFISPTFALPWVFQRRKGYLDALENAGLEADEGMVLWLEDHLSADAVDRLQRYLDRRQPTAILLSSWVLMHPLSELIRSGKLSVPRDLSVISFDQHQGMTQWLGNVKPTTVNMPLRAMGRRLAHMARSVADHQSIEEVVTLPCDFVEGDSVAAPRG